MGCGLHLRHLLVWLLLLASAAAVASVGRLEAAEQKRVLVLYTTRRDAQIVVVGERVLPRMLEEGLGGGVDYYPEYIDPARFPDPLYKEGLNEFFRVKYRSTHFDLVIAIHDTAAEFVAGNGAGLFAGSPVVFLTNSRVTPGLTNATGIVVPLDFTGTLALATELQPAVRRVVVVLGASRTDRTYGAAARAQFRAWESQLRFDYVEGLGPDELGRRLADLSPDAIVYYVLANEDRAGRHYHPLEFLDRTAAAASVPTYSWVDSAMGRGILGGSLRNQQIQVEAVGRLALRVLRGERAAAIPVSVQDIAERQVDWQQLRRWGISEARIPADVVVRYRDVSAWERYRVVILSAIGLLLLQSALIAALLFQRAERRRAETQVRGSEAALRGSFDRIRDLATRLLGAQEEERSRIARDLHDDIGQQMALLTLDLRLLATTDHTGDEGLANTALARAQLVARSVHELSHRLHPAKLRLIGLPAALRSLSREMAESRIGIRVDNDGVPPNLPAELTLPLFRIAQEALQNAIKYSQAQEISIQLTGRPDGLTLVIADDGVGFDVDAMWGKGLGLMSMRERLEAIGGTLDVRSAVGSGTRIEARVPAKSVAVEAAVQ